MARCMLREMCLPNMYWEDAVHSAIYIVNRSYTKMVKHSTPYEAWFYRNPNVSHFKYLGLHALFIFLVNKGRS